MPATRSVAFVPVILCLALHALPNELMAQQRAPVPDAQAEQAARKEAGEIYGGRFALAKTTAEKTALATEMIEAAGKLRDGAAGQYALLKVAVEIAAGAGDAPTALRAVEELVERFEVPGPKLAAETLLAAAGNATTSSQREAVGEAVLGIADAVADADEYALALKLCESARSFAQKAKQFPLAKDLTAKIEAIKRRQIAFQEYRAAWAVLDKSPTEPAANLATGRHLCFVKGDWDSGVPKLALGSDTALKDVAVKDLRGATSAEEQAAIGDAWWDLAETKQGSERDTLRLRAGFWYRQAAPKLAGGLTGLKTKERLAEVEKLGREMPAASQAATPAREPAPAMAPFDERAAKQHQMLWAKHLRVPAVQTNSLGMRMVLIPPGEFEMGSGQEEVTRLLEEAKQQNAPPWYGERVPAEAPKHRVKITKPFYLGICEVTQEQYLRLMGRNPSKFQSIPNRPVEQVDWSNAVEFCRKLSEVPQEKAAGAVYRLPTEAEWEFACRAGTTTRYSFGDAAQQLGAHAWWSENSQGETAPVGRLRPNVWGLCDMLGNVWEWCSDWHAGNYYAGSPSDDPTGPESGDSRVLRGGAWDSIYPGHFRSAYRPYAEPDARAPNYGFRVVRAVGP